MARRGPTQCIQETPNRKTRPVQLGGRYINLHDIARDYDLDVSYVSKVIAGKANPTRSFLTKLAVALGMSIGDLMWALDEHSEKD